MRRLDPELRARLATLADQLDDAPRDVTARAAEHVAGLASPDAREAFTTAYVNAGLTGVCVGVAAAIRHLLARGTS